MGADAAACRYSRSADRFGAVMHVLSAVTRLVTYRWQCPHCGEVQSSHPSKTSDATGAAKVQLGPRAQAVASVLNKQHGWFAA
jgi:hypothetical protein